MNTRLMVYLVAGIAVPLCPSTGGAQEGGGLEEVVVTAQKRSENIQNVGISMTAFSETTLREFGLRESTDVARLVPGVTLSGSSGGQFVMFNIRGVAQNEFSDFAEAPNAVYVDETYIAAMNSQRFAAFDLERVEVLKGPQGTLFGRNATGGLVHYLTKRPTDTFEAYADLTYGRFNEVRIEAAAGGPVSDRLKLRGAVLHRRHDAILENRFRGGDDEWNDDTTGLRFGAEWSLGKATSILGTVNWGESRVSTAPYKQIPTVPIFDADGNVVSSMRASVTETRAGIGPNGENVCPGCFYLPVRPTPGGDGFGYLDPDPDGLTMSKDSAEDDRNVYSLIGGTIRIESTYRDLDFVSISDFKRTKKDVSFEVDNSPANQLLFPALATGEQFSQELRLSGTTGRVRWLTGLYYLDWTLDPVRTGFAFPATTAAGPNVLGPAFGGTFFSNSGTQDTRSASVFADVGFDLTDRIELIAGARYVNERKDFQHRTDILAYPSGDVLVPNFNPAALLDLSNEADLVAGRLLMNIRPREGLLFFASVNRGVKAGGFNQNLAGFPPVPPSFEYAPEKLLAYETGMKSTLFSGTTRFNASVYHYDYSDYQAFKFIGLSNFVQNADARYTGGEIDIEFSPTDRLDLRLAMAYVDAEVQDVPFSSGVAGTSTVLLDREPAYTPDLTVNALVRYEWPLASGSRFALQADARYSAEFYYFLTNYPSTEVDSYVVGNLRASLLSSDERWSIDVFGRNLTDERYNGVGFDLSTTCGCSVVSLGEPRTYGVQLRYNWR